MNAYKADSKDIAFILENVLHASRQIAEMPCFAELDASLMEQVMEGASQFVNERIAPLNRIGDEQGAVFANGQVTMPPGFREAYQEFWRSGWAALSSAQEDGGQALPMALNCALYEWLSAANHGWTMAPGILHGAYECVKHHASSELKALYLNKLATGEWLATMCLTEPHAGSDLGLAITKAQPQPDDSYLISGTKIFISSGEHDLTDNIVHLVLARLPDSPAGPKGLSLFLVPKYYPNGERSRVFCERIEDKMGIHGSPTCVMRFEEARGHLVGEIGKGLNAMFVMMNAARLHVALQGVGLLDSSWQKANAYARERKQMRAPKPAGERAQSVDFIIEHPAIQRILDTQRAWIDGARVLCYQTGIHLDAANHHTDTAQQNFSKAWCALLTPVLKAALTEQGFTGSSECLQVFGGHGYVKEWGIEQNVRDARIAMIYEGTNEIQAIDLLMRKVLADKGHNLKLILNTLSKDLNQQDSAESKVIHLFERLKEISDHALKVSEQPSGALMLSWICSDYLRLTALAFLAWSWTQIGRALHGQADLLDNPRWRAPARALSQWILPEFEMRAHIIRAQLDQV
jgi:alkylation response protein AidB-like acyl-CoA dehydrogenase